MTEFLVRHFVKNHEDVEKVSVRTAYGVLASVVGIFCNVLLFVVKGAVGFFLHSVSVTVSYTHLDVYKRQLPYNNVSSFNSSAREGLKASFLKRQLQLSEAVPGMFMRAVEP